MPNTVVTCHTQIYDKMGNLDLYLDAIIFVRSITFSYQIRRPPATLRLAWKHRFYLVLNPTNEKLSRADGGYSVLEKSGIHFEWPVICQWHSYLFGLLQIYHSLLATEHKGHRHHLWIQDAFHSKQMPEVNKKKKIIFRILHGLKGLEYSMGSVL